jgi:asparagine synthase (glutamine-hydrolysing)
MCGVVGVVSWHRPLEAETLRPALAALRRRGPDGDGAWLSADRRIALGHTRLSIIDLHTGAQPIASEDGQVVVSVNGEFYGFEDVRRDLERRGHRFRTRSDSEIAVHCYEEWGVGCLAHLRGEFALLLWDQRQRMLLAARDRFGVKPLCYAVRPGMVLLASEAKALFALGVEAAWDHSAFFHSVSLQYPPLEQTLFEGVAQLRPGHYLLAHDGRVTTHCYWDFHCPRVEEQRPESDAAELTAELAERLDEAVRLRLRADVPVCFHLSGGLDSSTIVGLAARCAAAPLHCFTVSFEAEDYDELAVAQETAQHVGAELHAIRVSQLDLVENLSDAVFCSEGLAINGHLPAKYLLSQAIRRAGFKVVLSGEGADETFAGYPHLRQDLLAEGSEDALARLYAGNAIMAGIQLAHGPGLPLDAVERRLGFVPSFLRAKASMGLRFRTLLADAFLDRFRERDCFRLLLDGVDVEGQLLGRHRVDQSLYLWSKLALANYILRTLGDGVEMAHGLEGRLPFLDHHLFELTRQIPLGLKIHEGVEKHLLREAARPVLTDTVYRRRKHSFTAPPLCRFSNPATRDFVEDHLRGRAFADLPFFDQAKVLALLDRLPTMSPSDQSAFDPVLMTALTASLLQERLHLGGGCA